MQLSSPENPCVSVCIANYNGAGIIAECITSVMAQNCTFPVEIIVHDDASLDGSAALIRERFPQVKLIESADNVGFCVSNNRMARAARGEFLLLLNNDATLMQDALQTLFKRMTELSRPAILTLPQYDAKTGQLIDAGSFLDPFLNSVPNHDLTRTDVGIVIGACMWIPRRIWEDLGGFPSWFGSIAEDLYFCCASRLRGYAVQIVPTSGFYHRVGQSLGGGKALHGKLDSPISRRRLSERNKTYVMIICYPLILLLAAFPLHIIVLFIEGIVLSIAKGNLNIFHQIYWYSIKSVFSQFPVLLTARSAIQQKRYINLREFLRCFRPIPYKLLLFIRYGLPNLR